VLSWLDTARECFSSSSNDSGGDENQPPVVQPPVLATLSNGTFPFDGTVLGSGTLRLNMGPYSSQRLNTDVADGNETFEVAPVQGVPGAVTVTASVNPVRQLST
jgi:hypothetical protein